MPKFAKILIVIVAAALVAGAWSYLTQRDSRSVAQVNSFEECEAAGYPVGESHPRQCWTPDGKHFVEELEEI